MQYYYSIDGARQQGPIDREQLLAAGVRPETSVWRDGLAGWTPAGELPELVDLFAPSPASFPMQPQRTMDGPSIQYQQPSYGQQQATNGMAVASLVLGILGIASICLYGIGLLPAILAIVFGHIARGQIRRSQGTGDGIALAGLIMGYITVVLVILLIGAVLVGIYMASTPGPAIRTFPTTMPVPTPVPMPPRIPPPPSVPVPAGQLLPLLLSLVS